MNDPHGSVDNGHSMAGLFGLAGNPLAAWMLRRGYGELLALTPDDLQTPATPPRCPVPRCGQAMRYRGSYWACYQHKDAVEVPFAPPLQHIPAYDGDLLAAAGKTVDLQYTREAGEKRATWKYVLS